MTVLKDPPVYRTYLFTIWEERSAQPAVGAAWRFRLEDPHSGEKYLFATLAEVVQFLEQTYRSSEVSDANESQQQQIEA